MTTPAGSHAQGSVVDLTRTAIALIRAELAGDDGTIFWQLLEPLTPYEALVVFMGVLSFTARVVREYDAESMVDFAIEKLAGHEG